MDHGDYYSFYGQFGDVCAELRFSGYYAGYADPTMEATLGQLGFYGVGDVEQEGYYGGASVNDLLILSSVPPRALSEALYTLSGIATSDERDAGWSSETVLSFPKGK